MSKYIYTIYKHVSPSGKAYIGQTKDYKTRCNFHRNANGDNTYFHRAINKYGWNNFQHIILEENLTLDHANIWEDFYIKAHNALSPNGYNLKGGGNNRQWSDELKTQLSMSQRARVENKTHNFLFISEDTKIKMSLSHKGKPLSSHHILRLQEASAKKKGIPRTEEVKQKISKTLSGRTRKPHSEETKRKMSLTKANTRLSDKVNGNTGKKQSPETIRKRQDTKRKKGLIK